MKRYRNGFVLGKFCPLHQGHQYLIETAMERVEQLYIIVDNIMDNVIPVVQRMKWVKQEYPDSIVMTQPSPLPQHPDETPRFWDIWRETFLSLLPEKIDVVFASETYGKRLAKELKADFVMVDCDRKHVPVSATAIRTDIMHNWERISDSAKADMMTTVCVFGPESTGKTTLTKYLAAHYDVPYVPEYAETVIRSNNGNIKYEDMEVIVQGHHQLISNAMSQLPPLLFVDTDAIASKIWSNELFGDEPPSIEEYICKQHFTLYLLLDIDIPWTKDIHRYRPNERKDFFGKCLHELTKRTKPFCIIHGTGEARTRHAISVIDDMLSSRWKLL